MPYNKSIISHIMEFHNSEMLNIAIYTGMFGLLDLIKLSKINKETYSICQKYILKYYKNIEKIKKINIPKLYNYRNENDDNYWNIMFGKPLNSNELAMYYSYVFLNLHLSATMYSFETRKQFLAYPNGYIKAYPDSNGSLLLDNDPDTVWVIITAFYRPEDFKYYNVIVEYKHCDRTSIINNKFYIDIPTMKNILLNKKFFDLY